MPTFFTTLSLSGAWSKRVSKASRSARQGDTGERVLDAKGLLHPPARLSQEKAASIPQAVPPAWNPFSSCQNRSAGTSQEKVLGVPSN